MKERTQLLSEIKKLGGDQTDLDLLAEVLSDEDSAPTKQKHKLNETEIQNDLNQFIKQFDFSQFQHSEYDTTEEELDQGEEEPVKVTVKLEPKTQQIERIKETISQLNKSKVNFDMEVPVTAETILSLNKQLLIPQLWYLHKTNSYNVHVGENLLFEKAKELYQLEVDNYSKKSSLINKKIEKHG